MSRAAAMPLIGAAALVAGLAILLGPGLPAARGEGARYAQRIAGAMLAALGLFLAGFSLALSLTS